jgi:metal-sulfur cluster biosynthetic enzyme
VEGKIIGEKDAEAEITFDPPLSKDLMSEEAKLEFGNALKWRGTQLKSLNDQKLD